MPCSIFCTVIMPSMPDKPSTTRVWLEATPEDARTIVLHQPGRQPIGKSLRHLGLGAAAAAAGKLGQLATSLGSIEAPVYAPLLPFRGQLAQHHHLGAITLARLEDGVGEAAPDIGGIDRHVVIEIHQGNADRQAQGLALGTQHGGPAIAGLIRQDAAFSLIDHQPDGLPEAGQVQAGQICFGRSGR